MTEFNIYAVLAKKRLPVPIPKGTARIPITKLIKKLKPITKYKTTLEKRV
jgi:hypothetical protein